MFPLEQKHFLAYQMGGKKHTLHIADVLVLFAPAVVE